METVRHWSFLICLASVISASIEFLVPSGKIGKAMHFVLGIFGIVVFFTPLSNKNYIFKNHFKDKILSSIKKAKISEKNILLNNLNNQIIDTANKKIESIIIRNLKNIDVYPKKVEIHMDKDVQGNIVMIRCKIFVSKEDMVFEGKIKNEIENRLNIKTEVVKYVN